MRCKPRFQRQKCTDAALKMGGQDCNYTVYTDQVSKIHPRLTRFAFLKMMRRYKAVGS